MWARRFVTAHGPQRYERLVELAGRDTERLSFDGGLFDQRVKAVCAKCNSGWMSRLEERAKPLLLDLMSGRPRQLHRGDQQILAAWSSKTAFVAGEMFGTPTGITAEERRYLAVAGAPTSTGLVGWIGAYTGAQPGQFHQRGMALSRPGERVDDDDIPNVWAATLSIGPVLFHLAGCADPAVFNVGSISIGDLRLRRLWPYKTRFEWRPVRGFSDGEVPAVVDAIVGELQRRVGD